MEAADRLARDAAIWNGFPPVNAEASAIGAGFGGYGAIKGVRAGTDKLTGKEIVAQHGDWVRPEKAGDAALTKGAGPDQVFSSDVGVSSGSTTAAEIHKRVMNTSLARAGLQAACPVDRQQEFSARE